MPHRSDQMTTKLTTNSAREDRPPRTAPPIARAQLELASDSDETDGQLSHYATADGITTWLSDRPVQPPKPFPHTRPLYRRPEGNSLLVLPGGGDARVGTVRPQT